MMKNKYDLYKEKCEKYTEAILYSTCNKKIIIAGPGTGKSFLFKKICRAFQCNSRNVLVLSFINELVDNLAKELYGMAEVRTLHSFALSQLPRSSNKFSLNVEATIEEDYEFINDGKKINFENTRGSGLHI
jgi:superfamily I DNA/RNA helicase